MRRAHLLACQNLGSQNSTCASLGLLRSDAYATASPYCPPGTTSSSSPPPQGPIRPRPQRSLLALGRPRPCPAPRTRERRHLGTASLPSRGAQAQPRAAALRCREAAGSATPHVPTTARSCVHCVYSPGCYAEKEERIIFCCFVDFKF